MQLKCEGVVQFLQDVWPEENAKSKTQSSTSQCPSRLPYVNGSNRYSGISTRILIREVVHTCSRRLFYLMGIEAYPIPCQETAVVARKLVDKIFCCDSALEQLHSNQGRQFESQLLAEVWKFLDIQKTRTTLYHPHSDGLVERWNRMLLQSLAASVEHHSENWGEFVR